jgi:hypothetical protein
MLPHNISMLYFTLQTKQILHSVVWSHLKNLNYLQLLNI